MDSFRLPTRTSRPETPPTFVTLSPRTSMTESVASSEASDHHTWEHYLGLVEHCLQLRDFYHSLGRLKLVVEEFLDFDQTCDGTSLPVIEVYGKQSS